MLCRTFGALILTGSLLGLLSGCDKRPKYVLPTTQVPPPPPLQVGGGGGAPARPAPDAEPREKLAYPKELPADSIPRENKN
jgi:hypothetical protein